MRSNRTYKIELGMGSDLARTNSKELEGWCYFRRT